MTTVIDLNSINVNGCSVSLRIAGFDSEEANDTYMHLYKSLTAFKALTDPIRNAKIAKELDANPRHTMTVATSVEVQPGEKLVTYHGPTGITEREIKAELEKAVTASVEKEIATGVATATPVKRGPGRPRKNPEAVAAVEDGAKASEPVKEVAPAATKPAEVQTTAPARETPRTVAEAVEATDFDDAEEAEELDDVLAGDEDETEEPVEVAAKPVLTAADLKGVKLRRDIVRVCQTKGITTLEDIVAACESVKAEFAPLRPFTDMLGAIKPAFEAVQLENAKK